MCEGQQRTLQNSTTLAQHDAGTARHGTAQHSTAQHSTAQHSTAQHSTAQHSTAQHSTAQHSGQGRAQYSNNQRFLRVISMPVRLVDETISHSDWQLIQPFAVVQQRRQQRQRDPHPCQQYEGQSNPPCPVHVSTSEARDGHVRQPIACCPCGLSSHTQLLSSVLMIEHLS